MSFVPIVDFNLAYPLNQAGRLAEDQLYALKKMLKARKIVGLGLLSGDLFMGLLFISVVLTGDWGTQLNAQLIFSFCALLVLASVIYAWRMYWGARQEQQKLATMIVLKVVGEAQKFNYGTAVNVAGATHGVVLRHGWLKINGQKYGVLSPKLYGEIVDGKKTDFYVAPITGTGYAKGGVVINCSN